MFKVSREGRKVFVQDWNSLCCSYVWKQYKNEATARVIARRLKDQEAAKRFYERIREDPDAWENFFAELFDEGWVYADD